jgi:hypothetical protein
LSLCLTQKEEKKDASGHMLGWSQQEQQLTEKPTKTQVAHDRKGMQNCIVNVV